MYESESKIYQRNELCEDRIIKLYEAMKQRQDSTTIDSTPTKTTPTSIETPRFTFINITTLLTIEHFGRHKYKGYSKLKKPTVEQLRAFIHVRQKITQFKGRSPVYNSLKRFKQDTLIDMCFDRRNDPIQSRQFEYIQKEPEPEEMSTSD